MGIFARLVSKKLASVGGAIGGIYYIASLVASGGLALPAGLILAGVIAGASALHIAIQGQVDKAAEKRREL